MPEDARYFFHKSARLSDEEKRRLRTAIAVERCLAGRPGERGALAASLCRMLSGKPSAQGGQLVDWLLAYGTPRLLMRLKLAHSPLSGGAWLARAVSRIEPSNLLWREHIRPDIQRFQACPKPRTALVCFAGSAQKLSVPVQLFHAHAAPRFDLIVYLRDVSKQQFTQGIAGIAGDMPALFDHVRTLIPQTCRLAVLSASSGGYAAVRFAESAGADRLAMFSPSFRFKEVPAIDGPARLRTEAVRIYFGRGNLKDAHYAADWGSTGYARSLRWFDTHSHGTLRHVFECGQVDALMDWLRGGAELSVRMRRPLPDVLRRIAARLRPGTLMKRGHEALRGK